MGHAAIFLWADQDGIHGSTDSASQRLPMSSSYCANRMQPPMRRSGNPKTCPEHLLETPSTLSRPGRARSLRGALVRSQSPPGTRGRRRLPVRLVAYAILHRFIDRSIHTPHLWNDLRTTISNTTETCGRNGPSPLPPSTTGHLHVDDDTLVSWWCGRSDAVDDVFLHDMAVSPHGRYYCRKYSLRGQSCQSEASRMSC